MEATNNILVAGRAIQMTPCIDPATMGDGPCEAHAINEDLFRQVLREHWLVVWTHGGIWRCACMEEDVTSAFSANAAVQAWIDHVMAVASTEPLRIEGAAL